MFNPPKSNTFASKPSIHNTYIATVGLNIAKIELQNAIVNFQDLGGSKDLRHIWKNYYKQADSIFYMFNLNTFDDSLYEFGTIFNTENMLKDTENYNIVKMLLFDTSNLSQNSNIEFIIKTKFSSQLIQLMVLKECQIFEISFSNNQQNFIRLLFIFMYSVEKKIEHIMETIIRRLNLNPMKM